MVWIDSLLRVILYAPPKCGHLIFCVTVTNVCPNCVLTTSVRQTLVYLIRKIAAEWNNWDCFIYPKIASRLPFLRVYMLETQTKLWQHSLVAQIQTVVPTENMPKASEVRTLPNSRPGAVGPMVSALARFHYIHVGWYMYVHCISCQNVCHVSH